MRLELTLFRCKRCFPCKLTRVVAPLAVCRSCGPAVAEAAAARSRSRSSPGAARCEDCTEMRQDVYTLHMIVRHGARKPLRAGPVAVELQLMSLLPHAARSRLWTRTATTAADSASRSAACARARRRYGTTRSAAHALASHAHTLPQAQLPLCYLFMCAVSHGPLL
jgi:hypothetical protein